MIAEWVIAEKRVIKGQCQRHHGTVAERLVLQAETLADQSRVLNRRGDQLIIVEGKGVIQAVGVRRQASTKKKQENCNVADQSNFKNSLTVTMGIFL